MIEAVICTYFELIFASFPERVNILKNIVHTIFDMMTPQLRAVFIYIVSFIMFLLFFFCGDRLGKFESLSSNLC